MLSTKKHILSLFLSINSALTANQKLWYKNGCKGAAAEWGVGAVCLGSLGTLIHMHYTKLNNEKKAAQFDLLFGLKIPKNMRFLQLPPLAA